jgi:pectin methylesterase-like acyl-CoA thioesterase
MKCPLMACVLVSITFLSLIGCGEDSNPTAPLSTDIDKDWLLGNWIEVKFEYNYTEGPYQDKGTEYYNEASTPSYTRFTQNNAYWYIVDEHHIDTMSYTTDAKLVPYDDYGHDSDIKMERKGDTLIIKEFFSEGYEYDYYVKFNDPLPF